VNFFQTVRRNNPDDRHFHALCRENLKYLQGQRRVCLLSCAPVYVRRPVHRGVKSQKEHRNAHSSETLTSDVFSLVTHETRYAVKNQRRIVCKVITLRKCIVRDVTQQATYVPRWDSAVVSSTDRSNRTSRSTKPICTKTGNVQSITGHTEFPHTFSVYF
jgi:hypothetical protein